MAKAIPRVGSRRNVRIGSRKSARRIPKGVIQVSTILLSRLQMYGVGWFPGPRISYLKGSISWLKEQKVKVEIHKIPFRYNKKKSNWIPFNLLVFSFLFDFLIRLDMTF